MSQSTEPFACLTRPQKEKIAACFEQNSECHKSLNQQTNSYTESDWAFFIGAMLMGVVGGIVLDAQVRR